MDKNIDYTKLPPELRDKLEQIEANTPAHKQLKALEKLAGVLTLLLDGVNQLNQQDLDGTEQNQAVLSDIRNALEVLNGREDPETPDFATPVVDRLSDLEKSLTKSLKAIDVRPEVNVSAPNVEVQAPKIDLKGIEKALKTELPKAFQQAIDGIPDTPELDLAPVVDKLDRAIEQLESIDAASRMKPQFPNTMKVTNPDGTPISITTGDIVGTAAYSDSVGVEKKGLVDADRHVQVDVLTMPSITVDPPVGGATSAKQDEQTALLTTIEANQLPDGHNVTVDNASLAVTGTFWQATQPVSAAALPLPAGAATAANQQTDALTDTQLRATPVVVDLGLNNDVTVTGTVTANTGLSQPLTDTQLRATAVPVSGTFWQATQPVSLASVPSHAVTNAGTFAVQNTAATPAGTNAIGKLTQPSTATLTNVTMTGASVTLQASSASRRNLMIFNDSGATIYVKLGSAASSTSFTVKLVDQAYYELPDPVYTGIVTALGASGDVRVTETS